uniref:Vesicle transport v-SNARE N-terminal domain-containing protein n=1 Tax=Rhizochromulina marina TaxID=1034831 RepID=A0A7S2WE80_9STRA
MASFEALSDKYLRSSQLVNRAIDEVGSSKSSKGRRQAAMATARSQMRDAEGLLEAMQDHCAALPTTQQRLYETQIVQYRNDLTGMRRQLTKAAQSAEREELLGSSTVGVAAGPGGTTSSLLRGAELLEESRRVIGETEVIGDAVASDLEGQRHQLLGAHDKVLDMRELTARAKQMLTQMGRRECMHKCILHTIIIVLLIAIILVIYYRFGGGSDKKK